MDEIRFEKHDDVLPYDAKARNKMLPIPASFSKRKEIDLLFDGAEFIPAKILEVVRHRLFAAQKKYGFDHETFKDLIQICLIKTWAALEESKIESTGDLEKTPKTNLRDASEQESKIVSLVAVEKDSKTESLAYFSVLVRNTVFDYIRLRGRLSRYEVPSYQESLGFGETDMMDEGLRQICSKTELDEIIHRVLTDEEAAVIILHFLEGFSLYQISIHLERSVTTVKRRRETAVQKLRCAFREASSLSKGLGIDE